MDGDARRLTAAVAAEVQGLGVGAVVVDPAGELELDDFAVGEGGEKVLADGDANQVGLAIGDDRLRRDAVDREAGTRAVELPEEILC